jgi:hypothetical protein
VISAGRSNDPWHLWTSALEPVEIDKATADLERTDRCVIFVLHNDVYACACLKQRPSILRVRGATLERISGMTLSIGEGKQGITRLRQPFLQRQRYVYCNTFAARPARHITFNASTFRAPSYGLAAPTTEAVIGSAAPSSTCHPARALVARTS